MCFIQNPICFVGSRWQKRWWFCYCHMLGTFCAGKDFALITFSFNCLAQRQDFPDLNHLIKSWELNRDWKPGDVAEPHGVPRIGAGGQCPAPHCDSSSPESPWDGRRGEQAAEESSESMSLPSKQFCRAQHLLQLQVPFVSAVIPLLF